MKVLNQFGEASGGRAWEIAEATFGRNMDAVIDTLAAELRSQYSMGFVSDRPPEISEFRTLKLSTKQKGLVVQTRERYWAKA